MNNAEKRYEAAMKADPMMLNARADLSRYYADIDALVLNHTVWGSDNRAQTCSRIYDLLGYDGINSKTASETIKRLEDASKIEFVRMPQSGGMYRKR
jgi:hypothetical protein